MLVGFRPVTLKLWVDGRLVAERSGTGSLQGNQVPVTVGGLADGSAQFGGQVGEVRVATAARSDDWLKTRARLSVPCQRTRVLAPSARNRDRIVPHRRPARGDVHHRGTIVP